MKKRFPNHAFRLGYERLLKSKRIGAFYAVVNPDVLGAPEVKK